MLDDDLADRLAAWAEPFERLVPPDLTAIRHRARRRAIRHAAAAAAALAAVGATAALIAAQLPPQQRHVVPPPVRASSPAPARPGVKALARAPYYASFTGSRPHTAVVRRTATGRLVGTVRAPAGDGFAGIAAAGSPRAFILAVQTASGRTARVSFYRLDLASDGRPGPLRATAVPPLSLASGQHCVGALAGLAVTPDGRTLAASTLANCATGRPGPSRIEIASLDTGRVLRTIRPGRDYPLSLSWTNGGDLVFHGNSGVLMIHKAAAPGSGSPKLTVLVLTSTAIGGFSGAVNPVISPDGSVVLATVGDSSGLRETVAAFSTRTGKGIRLLLPSSRNPSFCGPLWANAGARHALAACGPGDQASVDNGRVTRVRSSWQIPDQAVPGAPEIAW